MTGIETISAGAGSGKTYRLTQLLEEAVRDGAARPEAVVATTFTKKAAAELAERVRRRLIEAGLVNEAQRLRAARIGTVHSLCGTLVEEFAFELGLAPELRVLDPAEAREVLDRSLTEVESDAADELEKLVQRFGKTRDGGKNWRDDVREVIDAARQNLIDAGSLRACAERSRDELVALLEPPADDAARLDQDLREALEGFVEAVQGSEDSTQATGKALDKAQTALNHLAHGRLLAWSDWASLANLEPGKKCRDFAGPVCEAASEHNRHPRMREDVGRVIELVFHIAAQALVHFKRHKEEMGVLDFVDQETLALQLLTDPLCRRRLEGRIDLLLVDEFQDTSPLELAVFLALAKVADRIVWVGDQKQAIYGFRDADPALMDAVIDTLTKRGAPLDTLAHSWRSRPELVHVTSDLFARPFAHCGMAEEQVRLEPAREENPGELGPVLEWWPLPTQGQSLAPQAKALADCVRQLLDDPAVRVRDPDTEEVRRPEPGDLAVLCRTNSHAQHVVAALNQAGLPPVLRQTGLLATLEARVMVDALRLWIDVRDGLAAAELARLLSYPDTGEQWLHHLVEGDGDPFAADPPVRAVLDAREASPLANPLEAVERVIDALGLLDLCRRWGRSGDRIANVEAFRAYASAYVQTCTGEGRAATVPGLLRQLEDLANENEDRQGVSRGGDAVTVFTWHGAKGLEWPITVLFEQRQSQRSVGCDVQVLGHDSIDMDEPLAGRWIRFWPNPYGANTRGVDLLDRVADDTATRALQEQQEREQLRLLYVRWTRARDRVVVAGPTGKVRDALVSGLSKETVPDIEEPAADAGVIHAGGQTIDIVMRNGKPSETERAGPEPEPGYPVGEPRSHPPASIQPGQLVREVPMREWVDVGPRLDVPRGVNMEHLGQAVHGFLAADRPDLEPDRRQQIAQRLLDAWAVGEAMAVDDVLAIADRFQGWVAERWPSARWHREWPLARRDEAGTIMQGRADLVLGAGEGWIIIDHKTFPGSREQVRKRAAEYGGQLLAYSDALEEATGRRVRQAWIHLPVSGQMVSFDRLSANAVSSLHTPT